MAERRITWKSEGAQEAAADARDVAQSQDQVGISAGGLAKVAGGLALAYTAVKEVLVESVKVYSEVDAEQGRIVRNLRQMGMDAQTANRVLAEQNKIFRENTKYGLKVSEQTVAYRELLDVTKDVAAAREDLALATDINADKDVGLAKGAEVVRKVRQGEVEVLKELGVLTKSQAEDLAKLTDETQRSAIAMQILQDEFAGAAEENAGLADELASNEAQLERIQIATGKVVAELGDAAGGFIGRTLDAVSASEKGTFTLANFATAFENLADETAVATDNLANFFDQIELRDIPELASNAGMLTAEGRAGIRAIAARGRPGTGSESAGSFIERSRERGRQAQAEANQPVGPELDAETRIAIATEQQAAEKEAEKAVRDRAKAGEQAEREAQQRWQRQQTRLAQDRVERERAAEAAEAAAEREAVAAERAAEREAAAAKKRTEDIAKWNSQMRADNVQRMKDEDQEKEDRDDADEESAKTRIANAEMAAQGALQAAGVFIEGEAAKHVMAGTGHMAEAAGAVARGITTSDPTQFIGAGAHVAAAVKHFGAAASSGKGGGKKGASSAPTVPSAPSAPGSSAATMSTSQRQNADLAGGSAPVASGPAPVSVTFQTLWPPTPQQVKDTSRILRAGAGGEV